LSGLKLGVCPTTAGGSAKKIDAATEAKNLNFMENLVSA
jgi:hypothetical protein